MQAMQYEITLPADYDMGIIRERVATKGPLLDDFPGLGLKAYLVRERADGSPVNQYSPFYLWRTVAGMNTFLWGDGFRGLCESFGRPVVQQWTGLAFLRGPATTPTRAGKVTRRITPEEIPDAVAELKVEDGVHSVALAVDTRGWELVRFTLYEDNPAAEYTVRHLSTPELDQLPVGRHW
ncbi:DUF4865 family protein [Kutzneria kofuensis]|uniref:DUF4865 domain-containing protein n=1 Tax=Kutzneria kofuensis TaxID=103725 RepID=A0A7W9KSR1_9PSEU|nr:DUF4865 family protein [Kutzneria kofuensis]MBB5897738.1 hypothetical protein [Kutzneria kofuensis]